MYSVRSELSWKNQHNAFFPDNILSKKNCFQIFFLSSGSAAPHTPPTPGVTAVVHSSRGFGRSDGPVISSLPEQIHNLLYNYIICFQLQEASEERTFRIFRKACSWGSNGCGRTSTGHQFPSVECNLLSLNI